MKLTFFILPILLFQFTFTDLRALSNPSTGVEKYLVDRLNHTDKRYPSFLLALALMQKCKAKTLVETGTARFGLHEFMDNTEFKGDGGSTIIFGHWASENKAFLSSVDISPQAVLNVRKVIGVYGAHVQVFEDDSVRFLKNFSKPVDFLYLDSFDYDPNNPGPSQEHHLKELTAILPKLHKKTIIMIDDCDLPNGGKGKLAIKYLKSKGWKVLYSGYQVIMMQ